MYASRATHVHLGEMKLHTGLGAARRWDVAEVYASQATHVHLGEMELHTGLGAARRPV